MHENNDRVAIVIPNLNGADMLPAALDSLLSQTLPASIIVIENASTDNSRAVLETYGDQITVLPNSRNLGFAGGVNVGIRYALEHEFQYIALFNNDAVADPRWLEELYNVLQQDTHTGIVTGRIQLGSGAQLDSTGEFYTSWGLPYPRGREQATDSYPTQEYIFGASGGASLYRATLLRDIGLFDETFFAYYEDTDISFRAQLAGWKVQYTPRAIVNHEQGATSKRMVRGFAVIQTFKNLPLLFLKNVPKELLPHIGLRFTIAYCLIFGNAVARGNGLPALRGIFGFLRSLPHCLQERRRIQRTKTTSVEYLKSIIVFDLPPDQTGIRKLRRLLIKR